MEHTLKYLILSVSWPFPVRHPEGGLGGGENPQENLPVYFPKARIHALLEKLELNVPSIREDYCGATICSRTQILNDEGALGATSRASLREAANKFFQWPLELAFNYHKGRSPICPSVMARSMATLLMADLHPTGGS